MISKIQTIKDSYTVIKCARYFNYPNHNNKLDSLWNYLNHVDDEVLEYINSLIDKKIKIDICLRKRSKKGKIHFIPPKYQRIYYMYENEFTQLEIFLSRFLKLKSVFDK